MSQQPVRSLQATVSCPVCGAAMRYVNGTVARSQKGVGTGSIAIMACDSHGAWDVWITIRRSAAKEPPMTGSQQRKRARGARERMES